MGMTNPVGVRGTQYVYQYPYQQEKDPSRPARYSIYYAALTLQVVLTAFSLGDYQERSRFAAKANLGIARELHVFYVGFM